MSNLYHILARLAWFLLYHPFYTVTVFLCACVLMFITYWVSKNVKTDDSLPVASVSPSPVRPCWYVAGGAAFLLIGVGVALLLYPAWLKWDDFLFPESSLFSRFCTALNAYFFRISRSGEFIGALLAVSPSRWQVWVLNPLFVLANSCFLWRLLTPKHKSIFSQEGLAFLFFSSSATLISCNITPWRNFWCFAASANYLWPTVVTVFFISLFNRNRPIVNTADKQAVRKCSIAVFLLGLYCGCSVECLSVIIAPVLLAQMVWRIVRCKQLPTPIEKAAVMGYTWGAFLLFGSPSLYNRAEICVQLVKIHLSEMTPPELSQFLSALTWQQIDNLVGGAGIVVLKEVPLLKRLFFAPFLLERFLVCACIILSVLLVLVAVMVVFRIRPHRRSICAVAVLLVLGVASACSYGIQCIPSYMSFLPPCWFLLCAACILFLIILQRRRIIGWLVVVGVLVMNAYLFVPETWDAWQVKPLEHQMIGEIIARQDEENIILHRPELPEMKDSLGLTGIYHYGLKTDPASYPNMFCAPYFKLKSIAMDEDFLPRSSRVFRDIHPVYPFWRKVIAMALEFIFGKPIQPFCSSV